MATVEGKRAASNHSTHRPALGQPSTPSGPVAVVLPPEVQKAYDSACRTMGELQGREQKWTQRELKVDERLSTLKTDLQAAEAAVQLHERKLGEQLAALRCLAYDDPAQQKSLMQSSGSAQKVPAKKVAAKKAVQVVEEPKETEAERKAREEEKAKQHEILLKLYRKKPRPPTKHKRKGSLSTTGTGSAAEAADGTVSLVVTAAGEGGAEAPVTAADGTVCPPGITAKQFHRALELRDARVEEEDKLELARRLVEQLRERESGLKKLQLISGYSTDAAQKKLTEFSPAFSEARTAKEEIERKAGMLEEEKGKPKPKGGSMKK